MGIIRILQVLPTLSRAGTETFVLNSYRSIDKSRYEFIILALSSEYKDHEAEMIELGGTVLYCDLSFSTIKNLPKNILRLASILKGIDYDIIHCHKSSQCGPIFLASYIAGKKKCIAHSHFSVYDKATGGFLRRFVYSKILPFLTLKLGNVFCACSEESAVALYKSAVTPIIINNGIDIDSFTNIDIVMEKKLRDELSIPEGAKVYANLSRFDKVKNFPYVVDIFNEIHKKEPSSILILAGKKEDAYDSTIERINLYHLQDSIRILGQRTDVPVILQLTDCVIVPSLNEGFSYQLLESQASSTPVVVSDVISKATDLELGLFNYLSLNDNAEYWAEVAMSTSKRIIEYSIIKETFEKHGLDIQSSAKQLDNVYYNLHKHNYVSRT